MAGRMGDRAGGDSIPLKIQEGLERSRTLLMCMSPAYFGSQWGALEHHTLLFRDPANVQRRFIPLVIEDCRPPAMIAQFAHIDWRGASDEAYDKILTACGRVETEAAESPAREIKGAAREPMVLEGHARCVYGVAVTPDGRTIVSGSGDRTLKVWDLETGRCRATFEGHMDSV